MSRHVMTQSRRRWSVAALLLLFLAAVGWLVIDRPAAPPPPTAPPSPVVGQLHGWSLFVERTGFAADQVRTFQAVGREAEATAVRRIADQPSATWFADDINLARRATALVAAATAAGQVPVLSAYFIPGRDCAAGHSAGGAPDAAAYRAWIGALAGALAGHRAVVILEPDAVPQAVGGCLDPTRTAERYALLAEAINAFRAAPDVRVYLDAGNPSWITEPARLAESLRTAGIDRAHGFALNVANFETTAANIAYGTTLSSLLGGAHFVIDTSRNGNGPAALGTGDQHWCNPPGRALGETPTTNTGQPLVDAYLWVKRPGESDGACAPGAPPAGQWYPEYALSLTTQTP